MQSGNSQNLTTRLEKWTRRKELDPCASLAKTISFELSVKEGRASVMWVSSLQDPSCLNKDEEDGKLKTLGKGTYADGSNQKYIFSPLKNDQVKVHVTLSPTAGFHHKIHVKAQSAHAVILIFPIPVDFFVDPFEIAGMQFDSRIQMSVNGTVDLEVGAYQDAAKVHVVSVLIQASSDTKEDLEFDIPIHLRYQAPRPNGSQVNVTLARPWVFAAVPYTSENACKSNFAISIHDTHFNSHDFTTATSRSTETPCPTVDP